MSTQTPSDHNRSTQTLNYRLAVKQQILLTPNTDKSIYSLQLVAKEEKPIAYQAGDWVLVQAVNPTEMVEALLAKLGLCAEEELHIPRFGTLSVHTLLTEKLELTQLNPAILNKLKRQFGLGDWPDRQAMMDYAFGRDILDLLDAFPSLQKMGRDFLALLSPLAPRYYSIASDLGNKGQLDLLYRHVQYETAGRLHQGVASTWLSKQQVGDEICLEIKSNPLFKLPASKDTPIVMIASGTGLAPFVGFMQQRVQQGAQANYLFFGEQHPEQSCLLCDQLHAWQAQGDLRVEFAFSRHQQKAYVQDKLAEQKSLLWDLWQAGAVIYLCGSLNKMGKSVEQFWQALFAEKQSMDSQEAAAFWMAQRKAKRIQMEVY